MNRKGAGDASNDVSDHTHVHSASFGYIQQTVVGLQNTSSTLAVKCISCGCIARVAAAVQALVPVLGTPTSTGSEYSLSTFIVISCRWIDGTVSRHKWPLSGSSEDYADIVK